MQSILGYEFLLPIVLSFVLISVIAAILGVFINYNSLNYLSSALVHSSLGGIGLSIFFGFSLWWGAQFFALLAGIGAFLYFHKNKARFDSFLDLLYALGMSLGALLISLSPGIQRDFSSFLFGSLILSGYKDFQMLLGLTLAIVIYTVLNFKKMLLISFDPDFAKTVNINVKLQNFGLIIVLAVCVTMLVQIIGLTSTIAIISVAPLVFETWVSSVSRIIFYSVILNIFLFSGSLAVSYSFDWPMGSVTGLLAVGTFLVVKLLGYAIVKIFRHA